MNESLFSVYIVLGGTGSVLGAQGFMDEEAGLYGQPRGHTDGLLGPRT